MIKYTKGNIINAEAEALVNTVNTVGIMGKGIALAFKKAFPKNYEEYRNAAKAGNIQIGKMFLFATGQLYPKYIINFPTKLHWKGSSQYSYVEQGLEDLVKIIKTHSIKSIAVPPLGSGNGKLDWTIVKKMIEDKLEPISGDVKVIIYESGFNDQTMPEKTKVELTATRAMLIYILSKYRVLGYSINLLVIQKLAWFLQRFGEPMKAKFEKGFYGPYSHDLMHLVKYLNHHYINFKQDETKPSAVVNLRNDRLDEVYTYCFNNLSDEQHKRVDKILKLIEGFESPFGLELLATVDFIRMSSPELSLKEIQEQIHSWTSRKKELMKPHHIEVAYTRLNETFRP